jgi:hypothetical protein
VSDWIEFVRATREEVERYGADRARHTTAADVLTDLQLQAARTAAMSFALWRKVDALREGYLRSSSAQTIAALRRRIAELEAEMEKTPSVQTPGGLL